MATGEAIGAVFETYAAERGKPRWGDKTPLYMQHLGLLERLFPDRAVRPPDSGRQRCGDLVSLRGAWDHDRGLGPSAGRRRFAAQWASEVRDARALGRRLGPARYLELRYEALVADPAGCATARLPLAGLVYDDAMLGYVGQTESARKQHQQRLNEPPRVGVRDWRTEMPAADVAAFEAVAGDLLAELGYEVRDRADAPRFGIGRLSPRERGLARHRRRRAALAALAQPAPDRRGASVTAGIEPCRRISNASRRLSTAREAGG